MKQCSKCKEWKEESEFYIRKIGKNKGKLCSICKICFKEFSEEQKKNNPEKYKQEKKIRDNFNYIKNKRKIKKRVLEWAKNNPDKVAKYQRNGREKLIGSYVKGRLCCRSILKASDISLELVELKREHIKLGRLLKGIRDENDERSKRKIG